MKRVQLTGKLQKFFGNHYFDKEKLTSRVMSDKEALPYESNMNFTVTTILEAEESSSEEDLEENDINSNEDDGIDPDNENENSEDEEDEPKTEQNIIVKKKKKR